MAFESNVRRCGFFSDQLSAYTIATFPHFKHHNPQLSQNRKAQKFDSSINVCKHENNKKPWHS